MSFLANVGRLFFIRISGQAAILFSVMYFTRRLEPGVLGQYFYFESVLGMVAIFVAFGIGGATEKYVSEGDDPEQWYSSGLMLAISFSVLGGICLTIINEFAYQFIDTRYMPLLFAGLIFHQLLTYLKHMFRGEFRAAMGGFLDLSRVIVFVTIGIVIVGAGGGALALVGAAVLGRAIALPIGIANLQKSIVSPDPNKALAIVQLAKYYFITVVGSKAFRFADVVLIGLILTASEVGTYEVAWRLILAAMSLNSVIAGTAFAYLSRSSNADALDEVRDDLELAFRYVLIIPLGVLGGAITIGPEILSILFTSNYVVEQTLLPLLAIGFVFQAFYFISSRTLIAINQPREAFVATTASVFINIVLNLILISRFGTIGAALATTVSFAFGAMIFYSLVRRHINIQLPIRRFGVQVLATVAMTSVLYMGAQTFQPLRVAEVGILTLCSGPIYFGILLSINITRQDLLNLFSGRIRKDTTSS